MALTRWYIYSFTSPETKTLLTAETDKETIILSLLISNYSASNNANVTVTHTDGTNTIFEWTLTIESGSSPFALDSKIVMEPGDEINVESDIDNLSVLASGDVG